MTGPAGSFTYDPATLSGVSLDLSTGAASTLISRWLRWHGTGNVLPVETTIDSLGRIVVPKALRDALGLTPGAKVDLSRYGAGLQLVPAGRTARLIEGDDGSLVAESSTPISDDVVFGLLDSGRR